MSRKFRISGRIVETVDPVEERARAKYLRRLAIPGTERLERAAGEEKLTALVVSPFGLYASKNQCLEVELAAQIAVEELGKC